MNKLVGIANLRLQIILILLFAIQELGAELSQADLATPLCKTEANYEPI